MSHVPRHKLHTGKYTSHVALPLAMHLERLAALHVCSPHRTHADIAQELLRLVAESLALELLFRGEGLR